MVASGLTSGSVSHCLILCLCSYCKFPESFLDGSRAPVVSHPISLQGQSSEPPPHPEGRGCLTHAPTDYVFLRAVPPSGFLSHAPCTSLEGTVERSLCWDSKSCLWLFQRVSPAGSGEAGMPSEAMLSRAPWVLSDRDTLPLMCPFRVCWCAPGTVTRVGPASKSRFDGWETQAAWAAARTIKSVTLRALGHPGRRSDPLLLPSLLPGKPSPGRRARPVRRSNRNQALTFSAVRQWG